MQIGREIFVPGESCPDLALVRREVADLGTLSTRSALNGGSSYQGRDTTRALIIDKALSAGTPPHPGVCGPIPGLSTELMRLRLGAEGKLLD